MTSNNDQHRDLMSTCKVEQNRIKSFISESELDELSRITISEQRLQREYHCF